MMDTQTILDKVVLVKLTARAWSATKKIASETVIDSQYNASDLGVVKRLIDKTELQPIQQEAGAARAFLASKALPFPIQGIYAVPKSLVASVVEELHKINNKYEIAASAFAFKYPSLHNKRRLELGSLYDPQDWPSNGRLHDMFGLSWTLVTVGPADDLPDSIKHDEINKFKSMIAEFGQEATTALRVRFAELIDNACERLTGTRTDKHGLSKPKIFKDSLVENIQEFVGIFKDLNVVGDVDLEKQVERAKKMVQGIDASKLRDNLGLKTQLAAQFNHLQGALDGMMIDRPTRKITKLSPPPTAANGG